MVFLRLFFAIFDGQESFILSKNNYIQWFPTLIIFLVDDFSILQKRVQLTQYLKQMVDFLHAWEKNILFYNPVS